jgi:hypothetical protein
MTECRDDKVNQYGDCANNSKNGKAGLNKLV